MVRKIARRSRSYPKIDVHTHVALPEVLALASKVKIRGKEPGKQHWVPSASRQEHGRQSSSASATLSKPKPRLKDMDRMGVDMQVISMNLPTPSYWADGATGQQIARQCNDSIAEFVAAYPERYIGLGAVPLQDQSRTVKELEYLAKIGLKGVAIPSHVRAKDLGIPKFRNFWAKAEELNLPIYIHPRGFTHDQRLHEFFLWNSVGQPLEETLAMTSIIYEGILDDFPKLKIIIAHGGGYLPYYAGRTDKAYESRPETRKNIASRPSDYLSRFFYDTVIFDRDMLPLLVKKAGDRQIMMGTDYPRGEIEEDPIGFVRRSKDLSPLSKDRIIGLNAAKLFNI
ncbi:MAG: amidohydrolase [Rhodospirillaceae bacterium]|jgi:aminocarboxymuconate-semialdehyde decarboxylase|nr:amidohydrolase [Rhodospirillaceae bacterium]MBT4937856.1 amidohydrolase [Rhodospirillaceae bacterium]